MKNIVFKAGAAIAVALSTFACADIENLNVNPNTTTKGNADMLSTGVVMSFVNRSSFSTNAYLSKYFFWGEQLEKNQYNSISNSSFDPLLNVTNGQKMVECANESIKASYEGLYYLQKAMLFFDATMQMGDIPYSEALNIERYRYPKYDEQKDVFAGILSDLEQADKLFSEASHPISGDPFNYGGDVSLWRKASNSLRMRVLMALSKRADDTPELKIKDTFKSIVNSGVYIKEGEDLIIEFSSKDGQTNPIKQENWKSINLVAASTVLVNTLKELEDYRLFHYLSPMTAATTPADSYDSYMGIDPSIVFSEGCKQINSGEYCRVNEFLRSTDIGVPFVFIGSSETYFLMAEAAERGWISGSAKSYYDKGVAASMNYVKKYYTENKGMDITDSYIAGYLSGKAAYKGGNEGIKQIMIQKYLASFLNGNLETWYDYRRTGYPEFPINPDTNLNEDKNSIPVRYLYPTSETNYNKEQLEIALERQWGGVESVNKMMWILK